MVLLRKACPEEKTPKFIKGRVESICYTSAGQPDVLQTVESPGHVIEDGRARAENLRSRDFRIKRDQSEIKGIKL